MEKFKGIAASEGIVHAAAFVVAKPVFNIPTAKASSEQAEMKRFDDAVSATVDQLAEIKAKSSDRLTPDKLEIFDAHIAIACDPELRERVLEAVRSDTNAPQGIRDAIDGIVKQFSAMDDSYFKERAADVADVGNRLLANALGETLTDLSAIKAPAIVVAHDITPADIAQIDLTLVKGFVTEIGGRTSHTAIMARSLQIPAVVGAGSGIYSIKNGTPLIINGGEGEAIAEPNQATVKKMMEVEQQQAQERQELQQYIAKPSVSADGIKVLIESNIGSVKDANKAVKAGSEGIGLFRTEFLYMDASAWPSEEAQYAVYREVLEAMKDQVVVIRTLDIGGDKHLNYHKFTPEMNPFLGMRAIRFCLANPDIFKTQLRALLRASSHGKLAIMFPMVATIDELERAKALLQECEAELNAEKVKIGQYEVGIMVEIPSTAALADKFIKHCDFFSIGTNDLIQYTMAADRMSQGVGYLYQPLNPAILRLIAMTITAAKKAGKWAGMCGEMAGDPNALPVLFGLGLDAFSMSSSAVLRARRNLSRIDMPSAKRLANRALKCETSSEVELLVKRFKKKFAI